ncbi:hypothetical protein DNFV4_00947 [Nitrospira tepida]|uniref:Uncharacterized protein n=1 Tax=Nitrospira tepida TaxID=2973512 RepID=A0AA86MX58_9BACT|nr:hypothetical protein DNFV4_00947 [Nitrospira tepida]
MIAQVGVTAAAPFEAFGVHADRTFEVCDGMNVASEARVSV